MSFQPTRYALSVMCQDKVGLVARLTGAVYGLGGNIEVLHQGVLQGYFVFMLMVTFPDGLDADGIRKAIESAGAPGEFVVSLLPRQDQTPAPAATGSTFVLTLSGEDSPGILKKITAYLGDQRINIEGLAAETKAGRCLITARLTIPALVDVRAARLDLAEIFKQEQVQISLMHEDIFAATSRIEMP